MRSGFHNTQEDCDWLRATHLKGVPGLREFRSFVLQGNEGAPFAVNLYASEDPKYSDPYQRVRFDEGPPVYCVVSNEEG